MNFLRIITYLFIVFIGFIACNTKEVAVPYSREDLKRRTFDYFWETADSSNYQIPDRFPTLTFSSIAATGFGLSAYIAGVENKYVTREEAASRVRKTLSVLWNLPQGPDTSGVSGHKGFFYHFLNLDNALRFKKVELSSIDTGLLMAGILSCQSYFDDADNPVEQEIRNLADSLYRRVDWNWMMKENGKMSMGWYPEKGFIESDWAGYNEAMVLLVMAMGSPTHPIPASSWNKWCETYILDTFYTQAHIQFDPLFGHQYSHVWIDFRGIRDSFMTSLNDDYFQNSVKATLANKAYCVDNPGKWEGYGENSWGLTACDGPYNGKMKVGNQERQFFDYRARGACTIQIVDDGTIAPTAAGGSFAFTPEASEACLSNLWNTHYENLIGPYGFKDAFNLTYKNEQHPNGWFDVDYLGIDQGPILLQIQNHETGLIWEVMKKNPYIRHGLLKAGFTGGWLADK